MNIHPSLRSKNLAELRRLAKEKGVSFSDKDSETVLRVKIQNKMRGIS